MWSLCLAVRKSKTPPKAPPGLKLVFPKPFLSALPPMKLPATAPGIPPNIPKRVLAAFSLLASRVFTKPFRFNSVAVFPTEPGSSVTFSAVESNTTPKSTSEKFPVARGPTRLVNILTLSGLFFCK